MFGVIRKKYTSLPLNTSRFTIAFVYTVIHPQKPPIESHLLIIQFFLSEYCRRKTFKPFPKDI
ncbi:hypothetical protein CLU79DRAFT_705951 [Phycomyces nitens]|nr:hypothetical protein CLU79DRAFT_705951 [Phycomyces nitens]